MKYINISGYKFIKLNALISLQQDLKHQCLALELKGTILLSLGGLNIFLSGTRINIDRFYQFLPTLGLPQIDFKESLSNERPFKHMHLKIKSEIVTMGTSDLEIAKQPGPSISPEQFHALQEQGKDIIVLDTRNDYEVNLGKFKNAIHLSIEQFRSFPEAAQSLPKCFKDKTVVTYCTGGIRCEKAVLFLQKQGFKDVKLLEGGILKYLEKFPEGFFEGACFVFDNRIAVDNQLKETNTVQYHHCQHRVSEKEKLSEHYIPGVSCPLCFNSSFKSLIA